ncbi:MAG: fumarate reductase/succinate dehydrogenase flavoprotein subunit, partial [Mucilaginibacter sp.]
INSLLALKGNKTVNEYHRDLGHIMWEYCGMARTAEGLTKAKGLIQALKADFWKNALVVGQNEEVNNCLERAGRVADFIELGELMVDDALMRNESCGGHFRLESQTEEGEAMRNDEVFSFVGAWQYKGENQQEELHKEALNFEFVHPSQRSYK